MHERFSDRARHAMALANLEAGKLGHNHLLPAHLMLGLIAEGACVATEALRLLDVDLETIRNEVRSRMDEGTGEETLGRRAQTKELKEVINLAIQEARKFEHRYVGTEHMVLALLAYSDGIPSKVLREHGINLDTLRDKALGLLRAAPEQNHDLAHSRHGDFEWVHQQELAKAFRSPMFWHTMILAVDSANRLGASEVEPQHLLLALLRDSESGVTELLAEKGVTVDWLRERLAVSNGS